VHRQALKLLSQQLKPVWLYPKISERKTA